MIKSFQNFSNSNYISNNNIKTIKKKKLIPICRVYSKDDFNNEKIFNKENLKNSLNYESLNIKSYQIHKIDKSLKTKIKSKINKMNLSQKHKLRICPKYTKKYNKNNNINIINNNLKSLNKSINQTNNENKINKENYFTNKLKIKQINYISNNYVSKNIMKKSDSFLLNYKNSFRKSSKDKIKSKEKSKSNQTKNLKNNNSNKSGMNISTKDKSISTNKRSNSLKNKIFTIKEVNPFHIKSKSKTNRFNNYNEKNQIYKKNMKTSHNSNLCSFNLNKNNNKKLLTNKKINLKNKQNLLNNSNNNNYKSKTNNNSSLNLKKIKDKEDNESKFINEIQNKIKEIYISNNNSQNFSKNFPILNPFPQYVSEYSEEIYKNLLTDEKKFISSQIIDFLYMNNQEQINQEMRSILINWLIEVQDKFNYTEQTLFLTISLIDRYSSFKKILRSEYQLVGIACLFIACKHEEIELPNSKDFLFITENAYTKEELFNMEYKILKPINFEILISTQYDFYLSFCNKFKFNENEINFGKYLLNLTLLDYDLLKYSNSIIANSCGILSKKYFEKNNDIIKEMCSKELYNESLVEDAGLLNCINDINDLYINFNKGEYMNARNKFMREKYGNIINVIEEKKLEKI